MTATNIEWADAVWNPVRGCTRVSEGCRNCYAEAVAARFSDKGLAYHEFAERTKSGPRWTGKVELVESQLKAPIHWHKPRRVFVNSMSDLFHDKLRFLTDIAPIFKVMRGASQHKFLVLTKRPERMLEFCKAWGEPLPNVWLGVSVENQDTADERIPLLLQTPASVRFVSYEPALGPVDFSSYLKSVCECEGRHDPNEEGCTLGNGGLDWIIVGGESGQNARPFDIQWARATVEQCRTAAVPCFVKQLGYRPIESHSACFIDCQCGLHRGFHDRKGGDMAEWPAGVRVREFPR